MTKFMRGALIASTSILFSLTNLISAQDSTDLGSNLVIDGTWEVFVDDTGSSVDSGASLVTDSVLAITFNRVMKPDTSTEDDPWPYAKIGVYFDSTYLNMATKMVIVYKSTHDLAVGLPVPTTSEDGSAHRAVLSPAADWDTVHLPLNDSVFEQPWTPDDSLDLSLVETFSFANEIDDYKQAQTSTLELRQVYVSYEDIIPISFNKVLKGISPLKVVEAQGNISLQLPARDNYTISFHTLNGKEIIKKSGQFDKGITTLNIKEMGIASGSYILKVKTKAHNFTARALIK